MMMGKPMSEGITTSVGAQLLTLTKFRGVIPQISSLYLLGFSIAFLTFSVTYLICSGSTPYITWTSSKILAQTPAWKGVSSLIWLSIDSLEMISSHSWLDFFSSELKSLLIFLEFSVLVGW